MWQLYTMWESGLDFFAVKDITRDIDQTWIDQYWMLS